MARSSLAIAAVALAALAAAAPADARGRTASMHHKVAHACRIPAATAAAPLPSQSQLELEDKIDQLSDTIADLSDRLQNLEDQLATPDDQDSGSATTTDGHPDLARLRAVRPPARGAQNVRARTVGPIAAL